MTTTSRVKSIHDSAYQTLVEYLRRIRLNARLTQAELADRLGHGHDQSYVSKYERAERRLDVIELRAVCRALEIPLTQFVQDFELELRRQGLE